LSCWYSQDSDLHLVGNEVHIWISYLNMHPVKLKYLYSLLSDIEEERSKQFKFFKHRKLFIASHGFLHSVLSYYIDTPANEIRFSQSEHGKPFIIDEQNRRQLQFNLSHSNHLAVLAICEQKNIGVDIEHRERKVDWQGVIRRFFTQREQDEIFRLSKESQTDAFFQVWARKEAYMKVTGHGLSLSPSQFEVSVPPKPRAFFRQYQLTR